MSLLKHALVFVSAITATVTPIFPTFAAASEADVARQLLGSDSISRDEFAQFGRVAQSDIYYAYSCNSTSFGTVVLVRAEAGKQPVIWKQEAECVREVSWRDIDGDGTPEIKTSASGGGSGVLISDAVFYRWPANTPEPEEVVRFVQNSYVSSGLVWVEYGFEPKEFPNFTFYEDSFLPLGAKCPSRDECELVERKTFCIEECREEVPDTIVQEPGWPAFVEALAKDGFLPGNLEPSGDVPEVKAETQAAFDAWLSD